MFESGAHDVSSEVSQVMSLLKIFVVSVGSVSVWLSVDVEVVFFPISRQVFLVCVVAAFVMSLRSHTKHIATQERTAASRVSFS